METPTLLLEIAGAKTGSEKKKILKNFGARHSFKTNEETQAFLAKLMWPYTMPWRKEQRECLRMFASNGWQELVVQAIFGGGKTTMMLAMIQHLILSGRVNPKNIQICAFNVCIKNEIKKKLRFLGRGFPIQTFDSLIYKMCAELEYDNLKALDFAGKRKFIQRQIAKITPDETIQYLFVDEAQDLEKIAYDIFCKRFPLAQKIFVGDVFQSIQKEPRESMLWYMLRRGPSPLYKLFSMTDTPRVPHSVLKEMQSALQKFYPEFSDTIHQWASSSNTQTSTPIRWRPFSTYKEVYEEMLAFIKEKGPENVMVLTFSSAITVRGVLGDVSRVRQFLIQNDIPVNTNHKMMKDDCVFLSTANSSKGLERDHVFAFLTFPLELAFANFSDDLVVNLTTVALSRCKKSVSMYVPGSKDRFSKVLDLYSSCPKPLLVSSKNKATVPKTKTLSDTSFEDKRTDKRVMLEKEHSITEALRLSILSFETRQLLKSYSKRYRVTPLPRASVPAVYTSEEDCTFSGIVFETLILGMWKNNWPHNASVDGSFQHHDMFQTFQAKIVQMRKTFLLFQKRHPHFANLTLSQQVEGACHYASLHLACFQKIFWKNNRGLVEKITQHWAQVRGPIMSLRPSEDQLGNLKVQHNLSMPFLNGIADALLLPPKTSAHFVEIFEIKASRSPEWQENAMIQSILYGLSLGKSMFRVHLINVFSKEALTYLVNFGKDFFKVRDCIVANVQEWNLNCFLAKNVTHHDDSKKTMNIQGTFFLDGREEPGISETETPQFCFTEIVSPTKTFQHPIHDLASQLPQMIKDFSIRKIVVGRNLSKTFLQSLFPEITIFRFLSYSQPCFTKRGSWQNYLTSIGWFQHEFEPENKKSFLDWQYPQCTFMVQWAHLCCLYNLSN